LGIDGIFNIRTAIEIKWSDKPVNSPKKMLDGLLSFCKKNQIETAFVTTINIFTEKEIGNTKLFFIPLVFILLLFSNPNFESKYIQRIMSSMDKKLAFRFAMALFTFFILSRIYNAENNPIANGFSK